MSKQTNVINKCNCSMILTPSVWRRGRASNMEKPAILLLGFFCCLVLNGVHEVEASNSQSDIVIMQQENETHRTSFHFQPPQNWMNDPNAPMWYNGVYHLFYQHNPHKADFGDKMLWAHSVSYDLIHWIHLDHALSPTDSFDINSCWSGSATILPGNKPVILYTGIDANNQQVQNLATPKDPSDPLLEEWIKFPQNPLMTPPSGVERDNFRDPTTAWQGPDGKWRVVVGSWRHNQGTAILYRSDDFVNWTKHEDPLYANGRTGMWECPDFFPVSINGKNGVDTSVVSPAVRHVMKTSFPATWRDFYMIGTYDQETEKFVPDADLTGTSMDLRLDYGKFYASKTFFDSVKNRRILWAWVNESDTIENNINKGWAGLQSFPRQIWLDGNGKQLVQWPIEEINKLHGKQISIENKKLDGGSVFEIQGITASQADLEIEFELPDLEEAELFDSTWVDPQLVCSDLDASVKGKLGPFGLLVFATKDLTEQTAVFFRIFKSENRYVVLMCSDQSRSSLNDEVDKTPYGAFVNIDPQQEKISLRTLIDRSIVENFGGQGRTCITSRVYPKLAVDKEVHLFAFNNGTLSVRISNLNAWSMSKAQMNQKDSLSCKIPSTSQWQQT